jgi:CMP-N-acetylneuraminic acid synthetase
MKTLAVIPARGGSKRIPNKNIRKFAGRPLISWTLAFARTVPWFDQIHVSTDSPEIRDVCISEGFDVPFLRSPIFASDQSATAPAIIEAVQKYKELGAEFDLIAVLQPTTPYRMLERWNAALRLIEEGAFDSIVGASRMDKHPYYAFFKSSGGAVEHFFPEDKRTLRSQDAPPAFSVNGSLYITRTDLLLQDSSLTSGRCGFVLCECAVENIDIDTEQDWLGAELALSGLLQ